VKEYYFYQVDPRGFVGNIGPHPLWFFCVVVSQDSTPTHSYMKMMYVYPMDKYPYEELVRVNGSRGRHEAEYELIDAMHDTFAEHAYWHVTFEYCKSDEEDMYCRITALNCSRTRTARLHVLPTMLFRNNWSWGYEGIDKPSSRLYTSEHGTGVVGKEAHLGDVMFWAQYPDGTTPSTGC
jgi:hypothetical protein